MALSEPARVRTLGVYTIGRKLGSGGMATVYAARQEGAHIKRLVALKVLSSTISHDDPAHDAFLREAHVATRLEHPNIVRTYDVGEVDGTMFLAMELVHGVSLSACQKNSEKPVPVAIAVRIVADVASALQAAHDLSDPESGHLGLVHQDVSPQNVLVGYDGRVKLVDFGVARLGAVEGSRTDTVRGKPSYLSPEQINGKNIDRRTDVFALGIVFWELLTGTRLFKRETNAATYLAILQDAAPYVRSINDQVPAAIADAVARALEKDRDARFPTAAALRKEILGVRGICGIPEATEEDIARWVAERAPETCSPADLEIEIVSESTRRGGAAASSARPSAHISVGGEKTELVGIVPDAPDLDFAPAARSSRPQMEAREQQPPAQSTSRAVAAAPAASSSSPSSPQLKVPTLDVFKPASAPALEAQPTPPPSSGRHSAPGPSIAFTENDDDDFDMQIERNISTTSLAPAMSVRPSGSHPAARSGSLGPARPSGAHIASTGLELAARPQGHTGKRARSDGDVTTSAKVIGFAVAYGVFAVTLLLLARIAHRPGGISVESLMPHAFDGTSATDSGAVALGAVVVSAALAFAGLRVTPRSWTTVGSAGAMLLLALAMVTVTLASSGENPTPPDGARLVPFILPLATLLLSFGVAGQGARLFSRGGLPRRLAAIPVCAIAGVIAFVAREITTLSQ